MVQKVEPVGASLAKVLNDFVVAGFPSQNIHIVGHSMGSHVSAYIGRNVDFPLQRITGTSITKASQATIFQGDEIMWRITMARFSERDNFLFLIRENGGAMNPQPVNRGFVLVWPSSHIEKMIENEKKKNAIFCFESTSMNFEFLKIGHEFFPIFFIFYTDWGLLPYNSR